MVKEGEAHASEDKKRRELVEVRNHAEALLHTTDKTLKEHGDKINATDREKVEEAAKDLRESLDSPEKSVIQQKMEVLTQASMALGEALYKASQEAAEEDTSSEIKDESATANAEDIVDADFEEVDDTKKE